MVNKVTIQTYVAMRLLEKELTKANLLTVDVQ